MDQMNSSCHPSLNSTRAALLETIKNHPSTIHANTTLEEGVYIITGVILQAGVPIGNNAQISIGAHTHIAPGVKLLGGVKVDNQAHTGNRATIVQEIGIGENALVAAGAVVIRDVETETTVISNSSTLPKRAN